MVCSMVLFDGYASCGSLTESHWVDCDSLAIGNPDSGWPRSQKVKLNTNRCRYRTPDLGAFFSRFHRNDYEALYRVFFLTSLIWRNQRWSALRVCISPNLCEKSPHQVFLFYLKHCRVHEKPIRRKKKSILDLLFLVILGVIEINLNVANS